jgi:hypothetical protein
MTEDMFRSVLDTISAKADEEGWISPPEGQLLTLYVAHDGVPLTIAKISAVRHAHGVVRARSSKGEGYFVAREDLFAISVDGSAQVTSGRKAGFLK